MVLDQDIKKNDLLRKFETKGFLGDPTRAQTLRAAGLLDAQVLVVARLEAFK